MPFLTIGLLTVKVRAPTGAKMEPIEIGETVRAFSGQLRTSVRTTKHQWDFATTSLLIADANAIVAAVADGIIIACSGNALDGATVNCKVTVKSVEYHQIGDKTTHRRILNLHLDEV